MAAAAAAAAAAADASSISRAPPAESEAYSAAAAAPPSASSPSPIPGIPSPEPSDLSPRKPPAGDAALPSSDAARAKKQAWKRPPNGSVEAGATVIGGAASWPALSESAKASPKFSPSDSPAALADAPVSAPAGPEISSSSSKPSSNPSAPPNHVPPVRQRSSKRGGGGVGSSISITAADSGAALPSPPPTSSPLSMANSEKQAPRELSSGDQTTKNTNWNHGSSAGGLGSQAHNGGDHIRSHGGNRRWNNGGRNNYSNPRDVDRGGYDGHQRNTGGRDMRVQPRGARPYIRPPGPPVAPPFVGPPQVGPYGSPVIFPDMPSPIFYVTTQPPPGSVPFVHHHAMPPAMFYPPIDPQRASLLKQIDFYFSPENLCRDVYLRQNMDEQGWVPISLIAGFNRVRQITNNIEFITDTLRMSIVVEVQGDKVRKRNDWMNWLLPPSPNQLSVAASQFPAAVNSDNLAARLQSLAVEDSGYHSGTRVPNRNEAFLGRSASGNLSNQLPAAVNHNWDENGQAIALAADSDRARPIRSLLRSDTF